MDTLTIVEKIVSALGGTGSVIALFIFWQTGLLKTTKNGGGLFGNSTNRFDVIDKKLALLSDNHLEHVQKGIDDVLATQREVVRILKEFEKYGIRTRDKR